jgi:hypothetical protein
MPAQPLLGPPPLVDEIVTVVDEQLQITEDRLARPRPRKPRLAKRSSCDRERVDRVRLATLTAGPPLGHRQLRRHTHLLLTNREQLPFQPTRQPPAVLERPQPLSAERRGPVDQLVAADPDGLLVEHPAGLVNRDSRHRLLVYVHSDHDHLARLQSRWGRPASGQTSLEAAATLLSGHARRSREGGGDTTLASQPSSDVQE